MAMHCHMGIFLMRICTVWSGIAFIPVELLPELLVIKLADDSFNLKVENTT